MKNAIYKGVTYIVPSWAKWITEDLDGALYAYELKPWYDRGYWFRSDCRSESLAQLDVVNIVELD